MSFFVIRRLAAFSLAVAALAGCQSTAKRPSDANANVDMESIAEAPTPDIKPSTYIAAGDLAASRNQFVQAAQQYGKALEVTPKDAPVIKKMALAQVKAGDTDGAIASLQRYEAVTDGSADAYGSLGYAYELGGKADLAEKTYLEGIKKHPDGALVHVNYGLMLVRHARVDDAVKQLSVALAPHEVNYDIAGVYEQMGRKDLAEFYYRRALECDPNFSPARQKLTMVETN